MSQVVDWKGLLQDAAAGAQDAVDKVTAEGKRGVFVGVGASGDRTLRADRDAESAIVRTLRKVPGVRVLAEEGGETGSSKSRFTAVVDPLDGSSNYQRGIPFYCTSIGVVEGKGIQGARAALVRNLVNGDVYYAEKGKGASKNGRPIATSGMKSVEGAAIGADLSRGGLEATRRLAPLLSKSRQLHLGANCLELCLLAEGQTDAFIDVRGKTRLVDFAGGYLIAKEAGATLTSPSGGRLSPPLSLRSRFSYIASANPVLHRKLVDACNRAVAD